MGTKDEALKLALEALKNWYDVDRYPANGETQQDKAIIAIEQALAAPVQEPVGEVVVESMGVRGSDAMRVRMHFYKEIPPIGSKIYTTPPAAQPAPVQSCYCPNCEAMGKELENK